MKKTFATVCVAVLAASTSPSTWAQEVSIRAAHFISAQQSLFRSTFTTWVDRVNAEGRGLVKIASVVSEESIPGMQMPTALRNGVIDMAVVPPSYYFNVIPEGESTVLSEVPIQDQRKNGVIALLDSLVGQKLNAHFVGMYGYGVRFHVFLNKEVAKIEDFKPLKLRTTPAYRPFFNRLVSAQIQTPRGEVYTALERGVVDGYANPMSEVKPMGWDKVSKYRVDPGFYSAMAHVLVNKTFWDGLRPEQRAFIDRMGAEVLERELSPQMAATDIAMGKQLVDAGMKVITLPGDAATQYVKLALDAHWDEIAKLTPDNAKKLRQMMSK